MKLLTRLYLNLMILISFSSCVIQTKTRKPKGDLNAQTHTVTRMDPRIVVDTLIITKIDTTLNVFKGESLIGFTIKGHLDKTNQVSSIDAFENVVFLDRMDHTAKQISIEIIPVLKSTTKKSRPKKTKVKNNYLSDKTGFEFYVEKNIDTPGFGHYQMDVTCGQKKETIGLFRGK